MAYCLQWFALMIMSSRGFTVFQAYSGWQALKNLNQLQPDCLAPVCGWLISDNGTEIPQLMWIHSRARLYGNWWNSTQLVPITTNGWGGNLSKRHNTSCGIPLLISTPTTHLTASILPISLTQRCTIWVAKVLHCLVAARIRDHCHREYHEWKYVENSALLSRRHKKWYQLIYALKDWSFPSLTIYRALCVGCRMDTVSRGRASSSPLLIIAMRNPRSP